MKYLSSLGLFLAAGPAFAHDGVHITPHGAEWPTARWINSNLISSE